MGTPPVNNLDNNGGHTRCTKDVVSARSKGGFLHGIDPRTTQSTHAHTHTHTHTHRFRPTGSQW